MRRVLQKESLELVKRIVHWMGLFVPLHKASQPFVDVYWGGQNCIYRFFELGGVRCFAEDAVFVLAERQLQCLISTCAMWVEHIACLLETVAYGCPYLIVVETKTCN